MYDEQYHRTIYRPSNMAALGNQLADIAANKDAKNRAQERMDPEYQRMLRKSNKETLKRMQNT